MSDKTLPKVRYPSHLASTSATGGFPHVNSIPANRSKVHLPYIVRVKNKLLEDSFSSKSVPTDADINEPLRSSPHSVGSLLPALSSSSDSTEERPPIGKRKGQKSRKSWPLVNSNVQYQESSPLDYIAAVSEQDSSWAVSLDEEDCLSYDEISLDVRDADDMNKNSQKRNSYGLLGLITPLYDHKK